MSNTENTHLFKAETVQDALAEVIKILGEEAVILESGENESGVWLMAGNGERQACNRSCSEGIAQGTRILKQFLSETGFSDLILAHFSAFSRQIDREGRSEEDGWRSHLVAFFDRLLAERPAVFDFNTLLASRRPTCFFFVGPTGQGKTATTAKLAVALVQQGILPVVASVDVEKSGGITQLEDLLRAIKIPVHTEHTREDLHSLLATTAPHTPILIDTPGLNLFNDSDRSLIRQWKKWTNGNFFGLLRAGGDTLENKAILDTMQEEGITHVGITHCDATRRLGTALSAVLSTNMTLEFLCDSPFISRAPQMVMADSIVDALIASSSSFAQCAA